MPRGYKGACESRKNCGAMMLEARNIDQPKIWTVLVPADLPQYAMNMRACTVTFFVCPDILATFSCKLMMYGPKKNFASHKQASRPPTTYWGKT